MLEARRLQIAHRSLSILDPIGPSLAEFVTLKFSACP
jgi:hypothetical protein